jgi:hypothetical protein
VLPRVVALVVPCACEVEGIPRHAHRTAHECPLELIAIHATAERVPVALEIGAILDQHGCIVLATRFYSETVEAKLFNSAHCKRNAEPFR